MIRARSCVDFTKAQIVDHGELLPPYNKATETETKGNTMKTTAKEIAIVAAAIVGLVIVLAMLGFIAIDEYNIATKPHSTPIVYDYGDEVICAGCGAKMSVEDSHVYNNGNYYGIECWERIDN